MVALALLLVPLAAPATPVSKSMTLLEAKRLSPQQLAERLLGAAGASAGYIEAQVHGNGGVMIRFPGLNYVELYKRPISSGNPGLCQVEGIHVEFSSSRYDASGDPPHRVTNFRKLVRFAVLEATGDIGEKGGGISEERRCAALGPVADRTDPIFFAVPSDNAGDAFFAMRAVVKAQAVAGQLTATLTCEADADDKAICANPSAAVAAVPIRRIHYMKVERCPGATGWCVHTIWEKSSNGKDPRMVELNIQTDAARVDWDAEFNVTAIGISSGVWIVD